MQNVVGGGVEKARVWDVVKLLAVVTVFFFGFFCVCLNGNVGELICVDLWLLSQIALIYKLTVKVVIRK